MTATTPRTAATVRSPKGDSPAGLLRPGKAVRLLETTLIAGGVAGLGIALPLTASLAQPEDPVVRGGNVTFHTDQDTPNKLTIKQHSDRAIVDFRGGFNIDADEWTHIDQKSSDSVFLGRDVSGDPSVILGRLSADGKVFLVNPNGVFFGHSAKVDVNSLVATTADVDNDKFMAGRINFKHKGDQDAIVYNGGEISAGEGGLVALVAPQVINDGVIVAKMGQVTLAGTETFTVDLYGDGLVEFAVDEDSRSGVRLAANSGTIKADGGHVAMTVNDASDVVSGVISMEGVVEANTVVEKEGEILLLGGSDTTTYVDGTLNAKGEDAGEKGGTVEIRGDVVALDDNTRIDASGQAGGGTVHAGGKFQGKGHDGKDERTRATATAMAQGAEIKADATKKGDGGEVVLWSDDTTLFAGDISAKGGAEGGNGGLVEVSGKKKIVPTGGIDTTAPKGKKGQVLFDPTNIAIVDFDIASNLDGATYTDQDGVTANSIDLWLKLDDADNDGRPDDLACGGTAADTCNSGDSIKRWYNSGSGVNYFYEDNTDPDYGLATINGQDAVSFPDANDVFEASSHAELNSGPNPNGRGKSMSFVIETSGDVGSRQVLMEQGGGTRGFTVYIEGGQIYAGVWDKADDDGGGPDHNWGVNQFTSAPISGNTDYILTVDYRGQDDATGTLTIALDGKEVTTISGMGRLDGHAQAGIGASRGSVYYHDGTSGASNRFRGAMGEVAYFNEKTGDALSTEIRGLVEQDLAQKWGMTENLNDSGGLADMSAVSEAYLEDLLQTTDVTLQADNNIEIQSLSDNVLDIAGHALALVADHDNDGSGAFSMGAGHGIQGTGGAFSVQAQGATLGSVDTGGGAISIDAGAGAVTQHAGTSLASDGGDISLNGDGMSLNGSVDSGGGALSLDGQAGTLDYSGATLVSDGGDMSLTADTVTGGALDSGGGALSLSGDHLAFGDLTSGGGAITVSETADPLAMATGTTIDSSGGRVALMGAGGMELEDVRAGGGSITADAGSGALTIRGGASVEGGSTTLLAGGAISGAVAVRSLTTSGHSAKLTGSVGGQEGAGAAMRTQRIGGGTETSHTINNVAYPVTTAGLPVPSMGSNGQVSTTSSNGQAPHGNLDTAAEQALSDSAVGKGPVQVFICDGAGDCSAGLWGGASEAALGTRSVPTLGANRTDRHGHSFSGLEYLAIDRSGSNGNGADSEQVATLPDFTLDNSLQPARFRLTAPEQLD